MFHDRRQAGRQLAQALESYQGQPCIVLALPRGGVPVAAEVAVALKAPLKLLLVRKVGLPRNPELAMGAIIDGKKPVVVRNDEVIALAGVSGQVFEARCREELEEIHRRQQVYAGHLAGDDLEGRIAIVVDDGLATGSTARAALKALRMRHPARIVLAVPVAPADLVAELQGEADEVICLEAPSGFGAVGAYYQDFSQLSDQDVLDQLAIK
ncbi:phosphoribosyltransferase [Neorhizobium petrolearium]|uniref:phosphoribosyltransferase n=1 Tax=Neorhizobium petrolearium TaxID=515361 RepID=UPI003F7FD2AF